MIDYISFDNNFRNPLLILLSISEDYLDNLSKL